MQCAEHTVVTAQDVLEFLKAMGRNAQTSVEQSVASCGLARAELQPPSQPFHATKGMSRSRQSVSSNAQTYQNQRLYPTLHN